MNVQEIVLIIHNFWAGCDIGAKYFIICVHAYCVLRTNATNMGIGHSQWWLPSLLPIISIFHAISSIDIVFHFNTSDIGVAYGGATILWEIDRNWWWWTHNAAQRLHVTTATNLHGRPFLRVLFIKYSVVWWCSDWNRYRYRAINYSLCLTAVKDMSTSSCLAAIHSHRKFSHETDFEGICQYIIY